MSVLLRLVKRPLFGILRPRDQSQADELDDGRLVDGISLVSRAYEERKRTIVEASAQSERVSR